MQQAEKGSRKTVERLKSVKVRFKKEYCLFEKNVEHATELW